MVRIKRKRMKSIKGKADRSIITKALQLLSSGEFSKANVLAHQILEKDPANAKGLMISGINLFAKGHKEEGLSQLKKAYNFSPRDPNIAYNYAYALQEFGHYEVAISAYKKLLKRDPGNKNVLHNLGVICSKTNKYDDSQRYYEKVIALGSGYAETHFNLAMIYKKNSQNDEALELLFKTIELQKDFVDAYIEICYLLFIVKNYALLYDYILKGLKYSGKNKKLKKMRIQLHLILGDYEEAIKHVSEFDSEEYENKVFVKIALVRIEQGLLNDNELVLSLLNDAKKIVDAANPSGEKDCLWYETYWNLLEYQNETCLWDETYFIANQLITERIIHEVTNEFEEELIMPQLSLLNQLYFIHDPKINFEVATRVMKRKDEGSSLIRKTSSYRMSLKPFEQSERTDRNKIKIGYLSNFFWNHPVMQLIQGVFSEHDKERFEIHFFLCNEKRDEMTEEVLKHCEGYHEIPLRKYSDVKAAKYIMNEEVDILIDLDGHTTGSRTTLMSFCPAPIQVSYLGFPGTSGGDFVDYIIADRTVVPRDDETYFSENVLCVPSCYLPSGSKQKISKKVFTKEDCGIDESSFVFCCFNQSRKIKPEIFSVWAGILNTIPGSVLWLKKHGDVTRKNLQNKMKELGVSQNRLVFADYVERKDEFLARLSQIADVALDTDGYNGHTTTIDALLAGVPVVTVNGTNFASRVAESILKSTGLPELVAPDMAGYENLAVKLATDSDFLNKTKGKIKKNRNSFTLFNAEKFTKDLESLYSQMWEAHCSTDQSGE